MKTVIPMALDECHPTIRKKDCLVIFSPISVDSELGMSVRWKAEAVMSGNNIIMNISENFVSPPNNLKFAGYHIQAIKSVLHELFELDARHLDRKRGDEEKYKITDKDYLHKRTEIIANERALRTLNKAFSKQGKIYDLDENGYVILT